MSSKELPQQRNLRQITVERKGIFLCLQSPVPIWWMRKLVRIQYELFPRAVRENIARGRKLRQRACKPEKCFLWTNENYKKNKFNRNNNIFPVLFILFKLLNLRAFNTCNFVTFLCGDNFLLTHFWHEGNNRTKIKVYALLWYVTLFWFNAFFITGISYIL